jgi:MFS-type transporter involved in bile tolerance (Atg22 family)
VLLLFGTTFLWFMPSFLGTATTVGGAMWSVIQLLVLATMATNLALHAIGMAVLLLVLLVPSLGRGIDRRGAEQPRHGT